MAAEQDIIREFLVSLGFRIDKQGLDTFVKGITAASATVVASVTVIEDNLERLFFASQRTKASAENIRAFGFSLSQMGSSAGAALEAVESLSRFMRDSPGAAGFLQRLGVATQDANGKMRDTTEILQDLGRQFAQMPYYRANAYAQFLGIDEKTLMALREGLGDFGNEYRDMLAKAGVNLGEASKRSHEFMVETRTLGSAFSILGIKISDSLGTQLTGYIHRFRDAIVNNFSQITKVVDAAARGFLWVADIVSTLAIRGTQAIGQLVDWFNHLGGSSQRLIATVAGLYAAWKLLNLGFLASPIGIITALVGVLALLYDDYQTWKEGGDSLIDWSKWEPGIKAAIDGIETIVKWLGDGLDAIGGWQTAAAALLAYMGGRWLFGMLSTVGKAVRAISGVGAAAAGRGAAGAGAAAAAGGGLLSRLLPWAAGLGALFHSEGLNEGEDAYLAQRRALGAAGYQDEGKIVEESGALFSDLERQRNLPNGLLDSVWNAESRRGQTMRSPAGAEGHFQFMPATAREYGLSDPNNLVQSAMAAARKYADLLKQYAGDIVKAIAGYNWGQGNLNKDIAKWGEDWLSHAPKETQQYVERVLGGIGNPYGREQIAMAGGPAGGAAMRGAAPTITQNNNFTVTGMGAPDIARAVGRELDGTNERLLRNARGIVQ